MIASRVLALWIAWVSATLLGGAYAFQYIGGLAPCPLCLEQRYPHMAVIVIGLVAAFALRDKPLWRAGALALMGVALATTAGIGAFHVGVEQGWWQGPTTCSGAGIGGTSVDAVLEALKAAPIVRCDDVPWALFGISMAGYNFLISAAVAIIALFGAIDAARRGGKEF